MNDALHLARYGKKNDGDRFVGLWVELFVSARQQGNAVRAVKRFFKGDVARAVESAGVDDVATALRDAARVYFETCLTDPQYSSTLFGMKRLPQEEVHGKMAVETALLLGLLAHAGLEGPSETVPGALIGGYADALGPDAVTDLRAALETRPAGAVFLL